MMPNTPVTGRRDAPLVVGDVEGALELPDAEPLLLPVALLLAEVAVGDGVTVDVGAGAATREWSEYRDNT